MIIRINTDSQQLLNFLKAFNMEFKEQKDLVEVELKNDEDIQRLTKFLKTRNIGSTDNQEINQKVIDHHYANLANRNLV